MILITAALLSLVVAIILVWPVIRRGDPGLGRAAYDLTVFQDQLKEVERDVARGVLTATEADAARLEIQRRILASGRAPAEDVHTGTNRSRWVGIAISAILVPLIAIGAYVQVGTPDPEAAQLAALGGGGVAGLAVAGQVQHVAGDDVGDVVGGGRGRWR